MTIAISIIRLYYTLLESNTFYLHIDLLSIIALCTYVTRTNKLQALVFFSEHVRTADLQDFKYNLLGQYMYYVLACFKFLGLFELL